jgi:hypothetical protein
LEGFDGSAWESPCGALAASSDLHSEQTHGGTSPCWLRAQRKGLPLQRIDLGVQRGDALTIPHVLR